MNLSLYSIPSSKDQKTSNETAHMQSNKSDLSRSLHELASAGINIPENSIKERPRLPRTSRRQTSAVELSDLPLRNKQSEDYEDRPVLRRKRFTRRQRKSVTIEPETGLILASGPKSSSDEEETTEKPVPSRGLSTSSFELSLGGKEEQNNRKQQHRGPAARRAGRRNAKLQYTNAASTNNLDRIEETQNNMRPEKRSMSVRDLHGQECDFSNQDSVTKWTSQILAELDSLPSSRIDLSIKNEDENLLDDPQKWSTLLSSASGPTARPRSPLNQRMSQSSYFTSAAWQPQPEMTSSLHTTWQAYNDRSQIENTAWQPDSNAWQPTIHENKWMTPEDNRVTSLCDLSSLDEFGRDREDSVNASTLVGSGSDSDSGTPIAMSPVPQEHIPVLISAKSSSPEVTSSIERRSVGIQGPGTPLLGQRQSSNESADGKETLFPSFRMVVSSEESPRSVHIVSDVNPPVPAKRTILGRDHQFSETKYSPTESNNVKLRNASQFDRTDNFLLSNIARLSRSVHGDISEPKAGDRSSEVSIPLIRTPQWTSQESMQEEETLNNWKKRAQCRTRVESQEGATSVDRVVASLIRTIEDARYNAPDRPSQLGLEVTPQTVATQTSPFSLSRSSSFDWINDMSENRLRDLKTPTSTPRSDRLMTVPTAKVESSSETDEADREVAEMIGNREMADGKERESTGNRESSEKENKGHSLYADMDESIAILLQYGRENKTNISSKRSPQISSIRGVSSQDGEPIEIRRPVPQFPMSESIYDNMERRHRSQEPDSTSSKPPRPIPRESSFSSLRSDSDNAPLTPNQSIKSGQSIKSYSSGTQPSSRDEILDVQASLNVPLSHRAGSCELLNQSPKSPSVLMKEKLKHAEEEALESCQWLRKAGFPQYANQYEEGLFPIDIRAAKLDHEFLETDSLRALFRRLDTLNRCAIMRIDNVVLRRRNENYPYDMYGCDDEDNIALSGNWHYQRNSHTWSRVANEPMYGAPGRVVSTSHNYGGYRDPYAVKDTRHSPYDERDERVQRKLERYDQTTEGSIANKLQRSQSERIKEGAKALMKRMNPRSGSRRRRESRPRDPAQMVISEPVLVSYDSASPESMRMMPRQQRPTVLQERGRAMMERPSRSKSARRQGIVLLSPSSPESSSNDDSYRLRRDSSVPPRAIDRTMGPVRGYEAPSQYGGYERFRRERPHIEDYLYPTDRHSLNRAKPRTLHRNPYYDNMNYYGSSGQSSPAYSSPSYSNRSYATPPIRARQLNIHPDGYYMHGSFELSPDASLTRRLPFTSTPSTSKAVPQQLMVDTLRAKVKSQSSLDNTDEEQCSIAPSQNRRDSGVGSSLSRSPSGPSTHRLRQSLLPHFLALSSSLTSSSNSSSIGSWNGGKRRVAAAERLMTASLTSCASNDDIFFSDEQLLRCMDGLSVVEMSRLRKMAYLRITAILEKHMGTGNAMKLDNVTSSGGQKNWTVQKLFKKIKQDSKTGKMTEENVVFDLPLETIYKRTGHCLPRTILEVLRYLRQLAPDTVGIFRKNGVKSRIAELRVNCDRDADADVFVDAARLDAGQVHDVADMLKQYLRELPDPLMTSRLSETFANIFLHVPEHERTLAVQFAVLLLPDENREALQTLLLFLHDVAKYSDVNNMPAQNLSVCFTPSLFHLSASRLDKISTNRRHKTIGAAGMPTEREMRETRAAQECLTHMIRHCATIFLTPEAVHIDRFEFEEDAPVLKELGSHGPRPYLMGKVSELIRENADRWKGWIVEGNCEGIEISSRKAFDSHPLRPIRVWVDVAAPPKEVMHRILRERSVWDSSVINWRSIDMVHAPDTELYQYVLNDTVGHPTRDCYVVRYHRSDISELRGACVIAERSVKCGETQLLGGVSAAVLDSRFLIEPKSGYSRVTYMARIDLRGRSPTWYNKVYGNTLARQMARLRDSFKKHDEFGPETKV